MALGRDRKGNGCLTIGIVAECWKGWAATTYERVTKAKLVGMGVDWRLISAPNGDPPRFGTGHLAEKHIVADPTTPGYHDSVII